MQNRQQQDNILLNINVARKGLRGLTFCEILDEKQKVIYH